MTAAAQGWHREEPHTADVRIELFAPTLDALFVQAGQGLAAVFVGNEGFDERTLEDHQISVSARDAAGLVVEFLNELIFHTETSGIVFNTFRIHSVTETTLKANVIGMRPLKLKTAVKAATYHGVSVASDTDGWHATVVLDV